MSKGLTFLFYYKLFYSGVQLSKYDEKYKNNNDNN